MITYVDFSLFESPARVLVNTVNTAGVMGKGIAKEFKRIYPEMFAEYQRVCENGQLQVGDLWLYKTPHKWILNFPTKKHWRNPSKPGYIEAGLQKFAQMHHDARITSISFPMLGCGNGELDWKAQVKPLMDEHLSDLPIHILIHVTPHQSSLVPEHRDPMATKRWLRSEPRSLAFTEVWDDLVAAFHTKKELLTPDGRDPFTAQVATEGDDDGIRIESATGSLFIYRDDLLDLWQQIREVGLCIPRIMPRGLDHHAMFVLALLAELPYLKTIRQAEKDTGLAGDAIGLLFASLPTDHTSAEVSSKQLQLV